MHPAFSVIIFSTLSGAGYGLLFWSALAALTGRVDPWLLAVATALALVLATVGLVSSLWHLGKPMRAWRAFSQWRTSWLSREGVAAVLTYPPALAFGLLAYAQMIDRHDAVFSIPLNAATVALCLLLAACALVTVACTAMIYASLKPIPAWRHRLVLPGYLVFALLSGGLLLAAIEGVDGRLGRLPALLAITLMAALWWLKRRYWRDIDHTPLPATRGDAVGLPEREVQVFERPHTEGNFLTREMVFVLARKHSRKLRTIAVLLFAVLPALLMLPVWLLVHMDAAPWFAAAAVSTLCGAAVERWLFFAEARHLVSLYY
ncbi:dimethyl sulfoxide reductase anchor subunit family protein [Lysobacter sp. D1-1-M9]|uniref:dimethyl sulfoxide reductase anchor subunit family protein n=1 Tax=Novilysobacter longmucuonensis TaxID=3098603 RepID=UPI002FCBB74E